MTQDLREALRIIEWEKVKGGLLAITGLYNTPYGKDNKPINDKAEQFDNAVNNFIKKVEDEELHLQ